MFKGQRIRTGSSCREEVWITIENGILKLNSEEVFPLKNVEIGERSGVNAPVFLYLPNGDQIILTENPSKFCNLYYKYIPIYKRNWLYQFETWKRSLLIALIVLGGATLFWLTIGSDLVAKWLANSIPEELEYQLGKEIVANLNKLGVSLKKPQSTKEKELENLFFSLAQHSGLPHTHLYITKEITVANAFAIPGGYIVFTSAMIDSYFSEKWGKDAIAGVIAHELGHIKYKHSLRILIKSALVSSVFTLLTGDVSLVSLAMAQQIIVLAYQRKEEEEADAYAIRLLISSKKNPEPFIQLLEDLGNRYHTDDIPEFIKTHPHTSKRTQKMRDLVKKFQDYKEKLN